MNSASLWSFIAPLSRRARGLADAAARDVRVCAGLLAATLLAASAALAQPAASDELQQLLQRAESNERVRIIVGVGLDRPFRAEGELTAAAQASEQRTRIATAQERLMAALAGLGGRLHGRFEFIPYLAAEVDAFALRGLMNSPLVTAIHEDRVNELLLGESVPLIGGPIAWDAGLTGAGWTVAVLDTGVDKTHPFLVGKVVSEACYSTASSSYQSLCPGGASSSTATGSGVNCSTSIDGCGHGTHVAGIATGLNAPGGFSGVAKDANLIAIKVFSLRTSTSDLGAFDSDIIKGLERVYALRSTYNIASVNMSLGGSRYYSACDSANPAMKTAIDNLRSAGIAVVIASGNNSYKTSMSYPACISSAVSVGASCDAGPDSSRCQTGIDGVASYSNIASFITLVAPGSYITSSFPGTGYQTWNGTSMATPHVAGAWALLKQQTPSLSVSDGITLLRNNAATIDDTRSGGVVTGLKLVELGFLAGGSQFALTVSKAGSGSGTVASYPAGINCGAVCTKDFVSGTDVTLTAMPDSGSAFAGWSGSGCSGPGACTVSMTEARDVTATFNVGPDTTPDAFSFTSQTGVALGASVTSNSVTPTGYAAAASISVTNGQYSIGCSGSFTSSAGTISPGQSVCVRHTASSTPGTTVTTTLTIGGINGTFSSTTLSNYTLTVNRIGTGSGTVNSSPSGIDCGQACSASFLSGTSVTLAAAAGGDSTFAGWSGSGCSGTGTCVVSMTAARSVTARFNFIPDTTPNAFGFTPQTGIPPGSTVTSDTVVPSGYNTATAIAVANGQYSIGCSGTFTSSAGTISPGQSVCVRHTASNTPNTVVTTTLTIGGVTGTFSSTTLPIYLLTVSKAGNGSGMVISSPSGISCGTNCVENYYSGSTVTLTATADLGSMFAGWSGGGCSGTGTCVVTMSAATTMTATFNRLPDTTPDVFGFTPKTGVAINGSITSEAVTPGGYDTAAAISVANGQYSIGCNGTFTSSAGTISPGQRVCVRHTSSSTPDGTVTTTLTIGGVNGNFSSTTSPGPVFALAVTAVGTGTGMVTGNPDGIDCGSTCSAAYANGSSVTLAAAPDVESLFAGWSGACSGTGACVVGMTAARSVTASFDFAPATAQKIAALYIAFFTRAAELGGLDFWKAVARDSGLGNIELMRSMADGFADHPSFIALYGALGNAAFVDAIYLNVGGKPADAAGRAYWLGLLNAGMSRSDFVADFVFGLLEITEAELQAMASRGEITQAELQDALARKAQVTNRSAVALAFVDAMRAASNLLPTTDPLDPDSLAADPAYQASQNIIRKVTEDPSSMDAPLDYLAGEPTIAGINDVFGS